MKYKLICVILIGWSVLYGMEKPADFFPITPEHVFNSVPEYCLPIVLCRMVSDYTKEWRLQSQIKIPCKDNPLWGLIPVVDGPNIQVIAHELLYAWFVNLNMVDNTAESVRTDDPISPFQGIPPRCFAYASKEKVVIGGHKNGAIKLYNLKGVDFNKIKQGLFPPNCIRTINPPGISYVTMPAISPQEDKFSIIAHKNNAIYTYSLQSGKLLQAFDTRPHYSFLSSKVRLAWNYDGTLLILNRESFEAIDIWDCSQEKPSEIGKIELSTEIHAIACSPQENIIAVKTDDQLSCFNIPCGTQLWSFTTDSSGKSLVFSPSGKFIASAYEGVWSQHSRLTTIGVWDVETGTRVASFTDNDPCGVVAFLSDDTLITGLTLNYKNLI